MTERARYDLVVAGSGIGGCAAALAAAELGLAVCLVEKADRLGGGTACSLGGLWVPGNRLAPSVGLEDDAAAALAYATFVSGGAAMPEQRDAFLEAAPRALDSFAAAGVRFRLLRGLPDHYYPSAPGSRADGRMVEAEPLPGRVLGAWADRLEIGVHNTPGVGWSDVVAWGGMGNMQNWPRDTLDRLARDGVIGGGQALVGAFLAPFLARGGTVLAGFRAERLLVEDGRVVGLAGRHDGTECVLEASRGVVLATGGYEGSPDLVARHEGLPEWMNAFPPAVEGDGLVMAAEAGAAVHHVRDNLAMLVGYGVPGPYGGDWFFSAGLRGLAYPGSIAVNRAGARFTDESQFQRVISDLTRFDFGRHDRPNLPAWMIFDRAYLRRYALGGGRPGDPPPDWLERADHLAGLAARLGIDPDGLAATVTRFNAGAARGEDPDFGRGGSAFARSTAGDREAANPLLGPIETPPFFGIRLKIAGISAAGLLTDARARVRHVRGVPIPGLYACGNAAAPTESGTGYQAGMSLARGMTFGWLAAQDAAGRNR